MKRRLPKLATSLKQVGFTMIELLIVISILGILSVAVLSAINPIEQINRGRDTGSRSDAEQLLSAIDRFYAFKGYYPWQTGADDANDSVGFTELSGTGALANDGLPKLASGSGELKSTFIDRIVDTKYNTLYIYNEGEAGSSTYVCFPPQSSAFEEEASTRCVDTDGSGLPDDVSATAKGYICNKTIAPGATEKQYFTCLP